MTQIIVKKLEPYKIQIIRDNSSIEEYPSVLDAIDGERVVSIVRRENGNFMLREACDVYFEIELTNELFCKFIDELIELCPEYNTRKSNESK